VIVSVTDICYRDSHFFACPCRISILTGKSENPRAANQKRCVSVSGRAVGRGGSGGGAVTHLRDRPLSPLGGTLAQIDAWAHRSVESNQDAMCRRPSRPSILSDKFNNLS